MKKNYGMLRLFILSFTLLFLSCGKNDDNPSEQVPNIVELAESKDVLGSFVAAINQDQSGLRNLLSDEGTFTVFAPSNNAFNRLFQQLEGYNSLADFDTPEELALLSEILRYHVVSGTAMESADLSGAMEVETLQSETLDIRVDNSIFIQDKSNDLAEVIGTDNIASNGIVHSIDKVLIPQSVIDALVPPLPSIVGIVSQEDRLSLFEEALVAANLTDTLNEDGPYTIFAPSNAAIEQLFQLLGSDFNSFADFDETIEILILQRILSYHVLATNLTSADFSEGTQPTLRANNTISLISNADQFVVGDATSTPANIVDQDHLASNGTVHIIDKILIPQEVLDFIDLPDTPNNTTIKDLVSANDDLEFLEQALEITGLLDTLGEAGPFTVFAPSNDFLTRILGLVGIQFTGIEDFDTQAKIDILRMILQYHIAAESISSSDFAERTIATLLPEGTIEIIPLNNGFALQDATALPVQFSTTDIPASNGVIHFVDRVLIPQPLIDMIRERIEEEINEFIDSLGDLDDLTATIIQINNFLLNRLDDTVAFTLFVPNDTGLSSIFGEDSPIDFTSAEGGRLIGEILAYHLVIGERIFASDFENGQEVNTVQGEALHISIDGNEIRIQDKTNSPAVITYADNAILNGVVHQINKVLLPDTVLSSM
ncbi:fasciclin domain-containing protein [Spongiimicrobium salis]|uniref:fasciclin domain-containing protein n=1 Tax=Spongiimicrobium salis TaxID=1667022 RepID=UPI00374DCE2B